MDSIWENGDCRACGGPLGIIEKTDVSHEKVMCNHCGDTYVREISEPLFELSPLPDDDPWAPGTKMLD